MKIKTADLIDNPLDWAVAKCEEKSGRDSAKSFLHDLRIGFSTRYSSNWSQGGPIMDREKIDTEWDPNGKPVVMARTWIDGKRYRAFGPTPLIAAMRCYVASRLGDEVEIPEEVLERTPIGQHHESPATTPMCCAVDAEEWGFGSDAAAAIIRALGDESPTNKDNH